MSRIEKKVFWAAREQAMLHELPRPELDDPGGSREAHWPAEHASECAAILLAWLDAGLTGVTTTQGQQELGEPDARSVLSNPKWAVTYAETAPHWYEVLGQTKAMDLDDCNRVGRVVRNFGEVGRFYSMTNLYLFTEDRRIKYWCIRGDAPEDIHARVINLATTERTCGPQRDFDMRRVRQLRLRHHQECNGLASGEPGWRPFTPRTSR